MLGVLCGLESEAAVARRIPHAQVAVAAAQPQKARWLARDLVKKGVRRLMSFGIAGALEPGLPIGSTIIGTHVRSKDGRWACDDAWVNKLSRSLPEAHCGEIWGSEFLLSTARDKRALYEKSRCLIVDMESQCVAQIAAEAGLTFAVVRVVCDTSDMALPLLVGEAVGANGEIKILRALLSLLRHPLQISDLIKLGYGSSKALRTLGHCAGVISE